MVQESFIHHRRNLLHYVKVGNGKHPLLVFHGFGQDHTMYVPLLKSLSSTYTLYIVDLFFHGKSEWNEGERPIEKKDWNAIVEVLLHEQRLDDFSLLGYSLGGKFALSILEAFGNRIRHLILVAPDGIRTNIWYSMATYPTALRALFKSMIHRYDRFAWIATRLGKLNLVDKGLIRFADYQMNSEEKRRRVYYSWVVFRHLTFDLRDIAKIINENDIRLTMITGKYDNVIRSGDMHRLLRHVDHYREEILESGHTDLLGKALPLLASEGEGDTTRNSNINTRIKSKPRSETQ